MLRSLTIALPLLALGACASQPDRPQQQAAAELNCQVTYPTGSNLPKRVCSTPMTAEERARLQEELQHSTVALPPPTSSR
ncbi:MAG: hypothetical protein JO224_08595 [Pelomonas sp.]|nr:hypothetical protein [Roseateles sp.]